MNRRYEWEGPLDLAATLSPLRRGRRDPTMRIDGPEVWFTMTTPDGPATQQLLFDRAAVTSAAWGPGADWLLDNTLELLGQHDDPQSFDRLLATLVEGDGDTARHAAAMSRVRASTGAGWRLPRAGNVWESAVAAVLEQKVTGMEAKRAWLGLAEGFGEPAPGPAPPGMMIFPPPGVIRRVPSWTWRRLGVDRQRSDTIMRLARIPHVLAALPTMSHVEARAKLTSVPGVGDWTYAEVAQRALGDADAVSVGDFHLAGELVFALTGALDGTDEQMLRILKPFAGHRYRAVRMVELSGSRRPRRGPRMAIPRHRYG